MWFGLDFWIRYCASRGRHHTPESAHASLMADPMCTCYPGGGYWMQPEPMPEGARTLIA